MTSDKTERQRDYYNNELKSKVLNLSRPRHHQYADSYSDRMVSIWYPHGLKHNI